MWDLETRGFSGDAIVSLSRWAWLGFTSDRYDRPHPMIDLLACTCEGPGCDRRLTDDAFRLSYRSGATVRRAYECQCGTVTLTVSKAHPDA